MPNRFINEKRPIEPYNNSEDPEAWADISEWESDRADYFESQVKKQKSPYVVGKTYALLVNQLDYFGKVYYAGKKEILFSEGIRWESIMNFCGAFSSKEKVKNFVIENWVKYEDPLIIARPHITFAAVFNFSTDK